jgi:ribosomal protein S6--L-glutamate ligase
LADPRIGVVGLPGGWSTEALADEVEKRTGFRLIIDMSEAVFDSSDRCVLFRNTNLCELDALIIKKVDREYAPHLLDSLELLRFVEESGVPIFSRPSRIMRLLDRLSCTITLRSAGIALPPTVVTPNVARAVEAVRNFGAAIMKPLYSTKARGMTPVDDDEKTDVEAVVRKFQSEGNPVMYIQKKIEIPGRDLGVVFLGGEYVGTYARVGSKDSWNTTIHSCGHYEAHEPSAEARRLAHRAQSLFELDFTSVDIVEGANGPVVFEVSAFGGYRGLKDALGVNAGEKVVNYVLEKL